VRAKRPLPYPHVFWRGTLRGTPSHFATLCADTSFCLALCDSAGKYLKRGTFYNDDDETTLCA